MLICYLMDMQKNTKRFVQKKIAPLKQKKIKKGIKKNKKWKKSYLI